LEKIFFAAVGWSADARNIPFADKEFDVVVSSLAIHNIYDKGERSKALNEIIRVFKAGRTFCDP
jgi:arsenite methyltransferase